MRLSHDQICVIFDCLKAVFNEINYELFLYGSRVDDNLKGGDIDLLIVTDRRGVDIFNKHHLALLVEIKKNKLIGQRRIDIKAVTLNELTNDPFLKSISDRMISLGKS